MAVVERYVNTAAAAGGDGTTNATSSGDNTHAYNSLSAWNTAEATDLVSANDSHIVYLDGAEDSVANVDLSGWTTDATRDITIQANTGNSPGTAFDENKYWLHLSPSYSYMLNTGGEFVTIRGMQLDCGTNSNSRPVGIIANGSAAVTVTLEDCLLRWSGSFVSSWAAGHGAIQFTTGAAATVRCINCATIGGWGFGFAGGSSNVFTIICYNFTSRDHAVGGIDTTGIGSGSTIRIKNALLDGASGTDYAENANSTKDLADIHTADASSPTSDGSRTFTWAAADDIATAAGDTGARDRGTDLSADATYAFDDDILGVTRAGTWDVGAYEYVAAGVSVSLGTATGSASVQALTKETRALLPAIAGTGDAGAALGVLHELAAIVGSGAVQELAVAVSLGAISGTGSPQTLTVSLGRRAFLSAIAATGTPTTMSVERRALLPVIAAVGAAQILTPERRALLAAIEGGASLQTLSVDGGLPLATSGRRSGLSIGLGF